MTAIAQMPIGRIIASSKSHVVSDLNESIEDKMSKIVDIITYRLPLRGVETTYKTIASDIFNLRFDIFSQITPEQLLTLSVPSDSEQTGIAADILPIYLHIMQKVLSLNTFKQHKIERISLQGFHTATSFLPKEQAEIANSFLDDSLRVEFALIASDCFSSVDKKLTPSVAHDLYMFLKLSFERYAARAAFLKIWNTDTYNPYSQLIRNIQIVQAKMEGDAGLFAFRAKNLEDIKTYFEQTI
jgi:hypothetical protein